MKKLGILVLTVVLCLSANGVIFADGVLVGDRSCENCNSGDAGRDGVLISDYAGVLISDLIDAANGNFAFTNTGVLISD